MLQVWKFGFLYNDTAFDTVLQVQEISQKPPYPKCPQLDQLDNRSYSTIQPTPFFTNNMKIVVGGCFLAYLILLAAKGSVLYTNILVQLIEKLKTHNVIRSSSPVINPSDV